MMISGVDIAHDDLGRDVGEGEIALDVKALDEDIDEHLPWPEPALLRSWWERERDRFLPGGRYLVGRRVGIVASQDVWESGFQRQRRAAAYELALATGSAALANWRQRC